jgi:hypothetical protein
MVTHARWRLGLIIAAAALSIAACARGPERACEGQDPLSTSRTDYLPCATAIIETMDRLDGLVPKIVAEDRAAEREAGRAMAQLNQLVKSLGDTKGMREGWADPDVRRLNAELADAYSTYYVAFYGVGIPFNALHGMSEHNAEMARKSAASARAVYERMRGNQ